jgi:hypothetical protein
MIRYFLLVLAALIQLFHKSFNNSEYKVFIMGKVFDKIKEKLMGGKDKVMDAEAGRDKNGNWQ